MSSCLLLTALNFSCNPVKRILAAEVSHTSSSILGSDRFESLYFGIIDSLRNIKAPVEQSSSYGRRHSALETSLARSSAGIDSCGNLYHNLTNKDSIPSKVVYQWRDRIVRDSIYTYRTDTLDVSKTVEIVKELNSWQKLQIGLGKLLLIMLLVGIVYLIYKWKLR